MKKISIVTVTFNTNKETHDCLSYLFKLHKKDFSLEIIVIDNGSSEPFVLTDKEKKSDVLFIHNNENLGFTGGYNIGIKKGLETGADYVMLINNDTMPDADMVKELFKVAEGDSKIGLVVPKIYFAAGHEYHLEKYKKNELGKVFWFAGGYVDWNNVFNVHRGVDEVDHGQYDKTEEIGFATGCCMLIPRHVFEKVGMLDDKYFLYFEDGDLNQRIISAGFKVYYAPKAKLWHITSASTEGSGSNLHDYFLTRNRLLFGLRYAPLRSKIALIRESFRFILNGREWQRAGVLDFYSGNMGKGSFFKNKK